MDDEGRYDVTFLIVNHEEIPFLTAGKSGSDSRNIRFFYRSRAFESQQCEDAICQGMVKMAKSIARAREYWVGLRKRTLAERSKWQRQGLEGLMLQ